MIQACLLYFFIEFDLFYLFCESLPPRLQPWRLEPTGAPINRVNRNGLLFNSSLGCCRLCKAGLTRRHSDPCFAKILRIDVNVGFVVELT